ncbi:unnamed protein product [Clonostachys rosea]|uniref:Choline monooxygenase, chloroplastic n=1 Tax=Bionectria ochroleuca TaxID=29856 RepID=A0ABY6U1Q9_BIOOC|nr:unnamed protein product [Clonostachys rosea]
MSSSAVLLLISNASIVTLDIRYQQCSDACLLYVEFISISCALFPIINFIQLPPEHFPILWCDVVPKTQTTVTTEYEVYRNPNSAQEHYDRAAEFFESIEIEDFHLMNGVQQNLGNNVFVNGPLHSTRESGTMAFKRLLKKDLEKHFEAEKKLGAEIHLSRRNTQNHPNINVEENFCGEVCACRAAAEAAA